MNLRLGTGDEGSPFPAFVPKEVDGRAIVGAELPTLLIEIGATISVAGELFIPDHHALDVYLDAVADGSVTCSEA
jgi:hypothetical protein